MLLVQRKEKIKAQFYENLKEAYEKIQNYEIKVVLGDFSAKVGLETTYKPTILSFSKQKDINNNGYKIIEATKRNLRLASTYDTETYIKLHGYPLTESPRTRWTMC